jgi:hypothetical protein
VVHQFIIRIPQRWQAVKNQNYSKKQLLIKLGLKDGPDLDAGIEAVIEKYGRSNANKYRAVLYYLLAVHFKKESVYNKYHKS